VSIVLGEVFRTVRPAEVRIGARPIRQAPHDIGEGQVHGERAEGHPNVVAALIGTRAEGKPERDNCGRGQRRVAEAGGLLSPPPSSQRDRKAKIECVQPILRVGAIGPAAGGQAIRLPVEGASRCPSRGHCAREHPVSRAPATEWRGRASRVTALAKAEARQTAGEESDTYRGLGGEARLLFLRRPHS
jgi:hypothetical protein